jgi:hypothetical protein
MLLDGGVRPCEPASPRHANGIFRETSVRLMWGFNGIARKDPPVPLTREMRQRLPPEPLHQLLSVTAQQPEPSVQSAIAKPSVFSTCLGTVRPKKVAATTARITTAMIFFMSPSLTTQQP